MDFAALRRMATDNSGSVTTRAIVIAPTMVDAATREATAVLLDQQYFQLDKHAFAKFNAALDASPAQNPRLRKLLARKAPWER